MRILVLGATSAIAQAAARIWAGRGHELVVGTVRIGGSLATDEGACRNIARASG